MKFYYVNFEGMDKKPFLMNFENTTTIKPINNGRDLYYFIYINFVTGGDSFYEEVLSFKQEKDRDAAFKKLGAALTGDLFYLTTAKVQNV